MESMKYLRFPILSLFLSLQVQSYSFGPPNGNNSASSILEDTSGLSFDFIVVGAGVGGCTVAGRLAEGGKYTVLLVEAGGPPDPNLEVPALVPPNWPNSPTFRQIPTVPQANAGRANNGTVLFPMGRALGGGSSVNAMIWNRGSPHDFNNWANLTGDMSWSYESLLKYFKRSEKFLEYSSLHRGTQGPISVEKHEYAPGREEWLKAGEELGYPKGEPNAPQRISFTPLEFSHRHGRRHSAYKGYIEPLLNKGLKNLQILPNTQVIQVVFQGNRAIGVRLRSTNDPDSHRNNLMAWASKEVIISAGAVNSPVILQKSGIGPADVLELIGVKPVKLLSVGRNMHDHVSVPIPTIFGNRTAAFVPERDLNPETWREYVDTGDGPYSHMRTTTQAFIGSSLLAQDEKKLGWADLQLTASHYGGLISGLQVDPSVRDWEVQVYWTAWLARPKSRGMVSVNPEDRDGNPLLDIRYLAEPEDRKRMLDAVKTLVKLCEETRAFRDGLQCRIPRTPLAPCRHLRFGSDPYWGCYIAQMSATGYHGAGSCKMGGEGDPEAVVDTKLRVVGMEGLRVVDASIMPQVTNANTQAPTYAIGEKAAEMILERWERPNGSVSASGRVQLKTAH